ncbi:MAG: FAD-dependent 5-carboxymethylaminomethyl-2-thiouridine(34) oxidoreductase MnmC [Rhodoferax sp.]|nr:FAD-dependent 5-carboxymethylaminomethyl-2-thiouridine(34) oxidoreductase MnmC [Rhodoferax sp.]
MQIQPSFLHGCGLPQAWAGRPQWCVLETSFGAGLNFLKTWQAWKADPARPRILHFAACEPFPLSRGDLLKAASALPELLPLAQELFAQWQGLLHGLHRLSFEDGHVLLSLGVGNAQDMLKLQTLTADSIFLNGLTPQHPAPGWELNTLKAVARCSRRGTRLAFRELAPGMLEGLKHCGFELIKSPGLPADAHMLQALFNPGWEPKTPRQVTRPLPGADVRCVVIGAGLAGASCAASLARRGWQVTVLDARKTVAAGASGLPAGMLAPHVSPDDSVLSRLSRQGLRATWQTARSQLREGLDWQACGVLQRRFDSSGALPPDWPEAGECWSRMATAADGVMPAPDSALWHGAGGWIKPAKLVQTLLSGAGIRTCLGVNIDRLQRMPGLEPRWQVQTASGQCIAEATLVVLAVGFDSAALLKSSQMDGSLTTAMPLQAIRGQLAWGAVPRDATLPASPVNGDGSFIPSFPAPLDLASEPGQELASHWLMGATFERDAANGDIKNEDQMALLGRLRHLLPATAASLAPEFEHGQARAWAGVRCASPDHLPLVGALDESTLPGVHVCTALGSRGLTFAVLCAELLAAWLHHEPLPLEKRLADSLRASRFQKI